MNKLTRQAMAGVAIALGVSSVSLAGDGKKACALDTLDGLYIFSATGYNIVGGAAQPKAITELIRFNGDGTLTVPAATHSINGVVARSLPGGTGTYSVDAGCTGTLAFTHGPTFDLFIPPKGDELWMIQTDQNTVFQGNVVKLSR